MSEKTIDLVNIGNVIMDILIRVTDDDIKELNMEKGIMHLVDEDRQHEIITHLKQHDKLLEIGGSGPNVLRTSAILGRKCTLTGLVGDDTFGNQYTSRVDELNIINRVRIADTGLTGTSIILVTQDGQRTMNTCLGNSRYYTPDDVPVEEIKQAKYLFVTGYQWDTESQIEAMELALSTAKENDTRIAFDLADPFAVERSKDAFKKVIEQYADVVFANKDEARMMYQCSVSNCIDEISRFADITAVKIGKDGSLVKKQGKEVLSVLASDIDVVDTTAAGDMYAGGFMYGLTGGLDLETCAKIANFCAESVIQQIGAKLPTNIKELVQSIERGKPV
jgi:sugar/nucleoside kinase (ribokinase family)